MVVAPEETLKKLTAFCVAGGAVWGIVAVLAIYYGSTRIPPRLDPRRVWAEWRTKRSLWGLALILTAAAALLTGELIAARVGLRDLYWLTRRADTVTIGRLGGACGYLLVMAYTVLAALATRRRRKRQLAVPEGIGSPSSEESARAGDAVPASPCLSTRGPRRGTREP